ncbi:hypothetical protein [Streptomyces chattanoogensis]|uniref:Uncharacterized protein n=1 Tax=Streptomyces chattanoogensis TaxID=66876 RepID=A0A0N0XZ31_9ACTN|nr:hypothetical protein [Streptomyces chattanoogensis]KPC66214.1 hypothetical protein ADL29_04475 [Streptomyces chattanoogensis]
MSLQFIGIDPSSEEGDSPTVWTDQARQELVFQGWKAGTELTSECAAFEIPGHAKGIPDDETVVRIPARMIDIIREACDAIESPHLG